MAHHDYYITLEKKRNRKVWCEKRGKLHDDNRAKAKERECSKKKLLRAGHSRYEPKKEY